VPGLSKEPTLEKQSLVLVETHGNLTSTTGANSVDVVVFIDGVETGWKQRVTLDVGASDARRARGAKSTRSGEFRFLAAVPLAAGPHRVEVRTAVGGGSSSGVEVSGAQVVVTVLP